MKPKETEKPQRVIGLRPTKEVGTNPKDSFGIAKVAYGTIPPTAKLLLAVAMGEGARKYGHHNWRVSKVQGYVYLEACMRHLEALFDGEDFDSSTGIPHIAFVMATAAIYSDAWVNNQLIDNRPLPGKVGALISFFNNLPGEQKTPEELQRGLLAIIGGSDA